MSSSLFLQQCPTCLVCLIWIVFWDGRLVAIQLMVIVIYVLDGPRRYWVSIVTTVHDDMMLLFRKEWKILINISWSHPLLWFCLVSLFNGISTFLGYLMPNQSSKKNYLTHRWEDKGVHTFPKGICLKVNIIVWLEFELAYYDSAVQHFNHYTTKTPHPSRRTVVVILFNL